MSRPDKPATELDALLARPTPQPGDEDGAGAGLERSTRGRLETWLRGGNDRLDLAEAAADVEDIVDAADAGDVANAGVDGLDDSAGAEAGVETTPATDGDVLRSLPIDSIEPNGYQPRRHFDEDSLASLAESVAALGVVQPVVVREIAIDRFELVAGERRWRAAALCGLRMIPALVRVAGDQGALEQAIVENLHREDLNPLEEAAAYRELVEDFGLTQDEVAKRVGKSRSAVANMLRLLQLVPAVQRLLVDGRLSAGHARALLGLEEPEAQVALAKRVIEAELSVRQTEEAVRSRAERGSDDSTKPQPRREKSIGALEVQLLLEECLETRVEVHESGRGGRLVVRFADPDDLARILGLIGRTSSDH